MIRGLADHVLDCDDLSPVHTGDKVKGRSTFRRQKIPTFDEVDRVEHVQLWRQCRPRHRRVDRVERAGDS